MMKEMSSKQLNRYQDFIYEILGINYVERKKNLLEGKIKKLMRKNGIQCYDQYFDLIINGEKQYWNEFIDEITTHKTHFFREFNHFEFIENQMEMILKRNNRIHENKEIRIWSAGCSTGEEAYSLAMVFRECLPVDVKIKILATDISRKVLSTAVRGIYSLQALKDIEPRYFNQYCERRGSHFEVIPDIKNLVTFRLFNLMDPFPFKNTFDIVFCRNVMIYFDGKVQERLLEKFYQVMTAGGIMFIGHSESLIHKRHPFKYLRPTIYMK